MGYVGDKYGKKNSCIFRLFLGSFFGTFMEIIAFKAPGNYPASIWSKNCLIAHGRTKKPSSMLSGFLDVFPSPKSNYFLSLETPGHLTQIKKNPWIFVETYVFCKSENVGNRQFCRF